MASMLSAGVEAAYSGVGQEQVESNCVHFSVSISVSFTILPRVVSAFAKDVDVPFAAEVPLLYVYTPLGCDVNFITIVM